MNDPFQNTMLHLLQREPMLTVSIISYVCVRCLVGEASFPLLSSRAPAARCGLKLSSYPRSGNRIPRHTCHYVVILLDVGPLQSQPLSYFFSALV